MANVVLISIEVVYPLAHEQLLFKATVPQGARLKEGVLASGILRHYPELVLETADVGIFGKLASLDTVLRAKDRIEIYRPLLADPKEVRKQRAAEGKKMKKGSGEEGV